MTKYDERFKLSVVRQYLDGKGGYVFFERVAQTEPHGGMLQGMRISILSVFGNALVSDITQRMYFSTTP